MSDALRVETPARLVDVLAIAARSSRRRHVFLQRLKSDSVAVFAGETLLAVAMLYPEAPDRVELCSLFAPGAAPRMRSLVRLTHLMLRPIADHGVVILARIGPEDRTRARLHRLAGFVPAGEAGKLWIWKGGDNGSGSENAVRRWRQRRQGSGGEIAAAASGGE